MRMSSFIPAADEEDELNNVKHDILCPECDLNISESGLRIIELDTQLITNELAEAIKDHDYAAPEQHLTHDLTAADRFALVELGEIMEDSITVFAINFSAINDDVPSPENVEPTAVASADEVHEEEIDADGAQPAQKQRRRTPESKSKYRIQHYKLLPSCKTSCRRQCAVKFEDERRETIRVCYQSSNFEGRRLWLDSHIFIAPAKRRNQADGPFRRNSSFQFFLPIISGEKIQVCKTMFMATLGMKTDGQITEFVNARKKIGDGLAATACEDHRRRHPQINRMNN